MWIREEGPSRGRRSGNQLHADPLARVTHYIRSNGRPTLFDQQLPDLGAVILLPIRPIQLDYSRRSREVIYESVPGPDERGGYGEVTD